MTNSSNVNGVKGTVNREFITGWLKEGLGWDGMVVTDWGDIDGAVTSDRVVPTAKEAIRLAINAGVDMMMVPSQFTYNGLLKELVEEGGVQHGTALTMPCDASAPETPGGTFRTA